MFKIRCVVLECKGARKGLPNLPMMEVCEKDSLPIKLPNSAAVMTHSSRNWSMRAAQAITLSRGSDISMAISLSGLGNFPSNPRKVASLPIPVLIFLRKQPIRSQNLRKVAMAPLDKRSGGHGAKVIEIRQDRYPEYPIGQKGYCAG